MNEKQKEFLKELNLDPDKNYLNGINWSGVSKECVLSEEFIREFQDDVFWRKISEYQILSEGFIREFQDRVNWHLITETQSLTDSFLYEFRHRINWNVYFWYREPSYEITKKFISKTRYKEINEINIKHLDESQKKVIQQILDVKNLFKTKENA